MTIQKFIEAAIEGGYKLHNNPRINVFEESDSHYSYCWYSKGGFDFLIPEMILDPEAWQAVGKAKGWGEIDSSESNTFHVWEMKFIQMPMFLIKGRTLEEYIATL